MSKLAYLATLEKPELGTAELQLDIELLSAGTRLPGSSRRIFRRTGGILVRCKARNVPHSGVSRRAVGGTLSPRDRSRRIYAPRETSRGTRNLRSALVPEECHAF